MNVLINLLPDTRQTKLRDRKRRQMVSGVAVGTWVVCGSVLILMGLYETSQKLIINDLTKKITTKEAQLEATPNLLEALTAQQHLASLPSLYSQRTHMTKFFNAYSEANPKDVTLSSLNVDDSNNLTANGTAKSYASVAKLAKALEAEHVTVGSGASTGNQPYFTDIALQSVSKSNNQVSFSLNATVDSGVTSGN